MAVLDQKINDHFSGLVVRKDLVKTVKGNAIVPTYVLEYLLGQYCATNDEASIHSGIETVREPPQAALQAHDLTGPAQTFKDAAGVAARQPQEDRSIRGFESAGGDIPEPADGLDGLHGAPSSRSSTRSWIDSQTRGES